MRYVEHCGDEDSFVQTIQKAFRYARLDSVRCFSGSSWPQKIMRPGGRGNNGNDVEENKQRLVKGFCL